MEGLTVGGYLLAALGHAIVSNDKSDEQAIVAEDVLAAGRLRRAMALMAASERPLRRHARMTGTAAYRDL
jgi:hypothetical protein